MFSLSRLSMLIVAFFLGFAAALGASIGVAAFAVNSLTINKVEEIAKVDLQTEKVIGDNPEVDLRDLSLLSLIDEFKSLKALEETVTINLLKSRYDLIIHPMIDKFLSDESRDMPITYLMTDEGKDKFFSTLYVGQIQGFECLKEDGTPGKPSDTDTSWYRVNAEDPNDKEEITGLNEILANFTLGDILAGRVSSDSLLADIILADVLGYTFDEEHNYWVDSEGVKVTGVMAVFAEETILTVDEKLNSVEIGELLGYQKDEITGKWLNDDGTGTLAPVHGFMNVVAGRTLDNVGSIMEELTIGDIIPPEQQTGFVGLLDPDTKFDGISTEVNEKFNKTSMRVLVVNNVIEFESEEDEDKFLASPLADCNISELLISITSTLH